MKKSEIIYSLIKLPLDFLLTYCSFHFGYYLRMTLELGKEIDYTNLPSATEFNHFALIASLALVIVFAANGMYKIKNTTSTFKELSRTFTSWTLWIMAIISFYFFSRSQVFSRLAIFYIWTTTLISLTLSRIVIQTIINTFFKAGIGRTKVIIIGNNKISKFLEKKLNRNNRYQVISRISTKSLQKLEYICTKNQIDQIIQTQSTQNHLEHEEILEFCEYKHIEYRFIPDLLEVKTSNIEIETISGIPIINMKPTPLDGWGKIAKRIIDIIGSCIGMIILLPIFIITAFAIKMDSKGPILFTKLDNGEPVMRVGQKGRLFKYYKFRSMKDKSHSQRYTKLAEKNLRGDGPLVKIKNDPRVTKVGKFIRRYSIDELPQLWSVFIGDISLVGPRAHLPEEVSKYQNHHRFVLTIKPGITGLPQISGRSDLSFEEEVKLDRYYIENWSIWLDIKIILKTLVVIFQRYEE